MRYTTQMLMAKGLSRTDASMVEELTDHIHSEAMKLIIRMGETAPEDLRTVAILVACAKIQTHLEDTGKYMLEHMERREHL